MSQAGMNNTSSGPVPPDVPTSFFTDDGVVIPAFNFINFNGDGDITIVANPTGSNNMIARVPIKDRFAVFMTNSVTNVSGDGTFYQPIYDAVSFDSAGAYNAGTGVYTIPGAGVQQWVFGFFNTISNINVAHTSCTFIINNTGPGGIFYHLANQNPFTTANAGGSLECTGSFLINCAGGDTIFTQFQVSNGTKTVGLLGGATFTYYWGYRVG